MSRLPLGEREAVSNAEDLLPQARHVSRRVSTKHLGSASSGKVERPKTGPDENDSLEVRLEDLIQRHQASKTKHSTEVAALQHAIAELKRTAIKASEDNASIKLDRDRLRKERDEARTRTRSSEEEAARQRAAALEAEDRIRQLEASTAASRTHSDRAEAELAESKATVERLRREKAALEVEVRHHTEGRRAGWEKEKTTMQAEMDRLRNENARLIAREDKVEEMEDDREWLEHALEVAAEQCGLARTRMVDAAVHRRVVREVEALRLEREERRAAELGLRMEVRGMRENVGELQERLRLAERDRKESEAVIGDLLAQRRSDREVFAPTRPDSTPIEPLEVIDVAGELLVEYRDATIDTLLAQNELRSTLYAHRDLLAKYHKSKETLAADRATLSALRQTHKALEGDLAALQGKHDTCEARLISSAAEVARWQHAESVVSEDLAIVKEEKQRLESKSKREREEWKRANEGVARAMAAESAFQEEIFQLRAALESAAEYEDMYNALVSENEELAAREQLAAEEAERLGIQNAHLIGHGNDGQKISYVESVRREMALTKHELVSARQMLNKANEKVMALTEEVESYRSISKDLGMGGSTRTRVVRRAPEGSWLAKSARVSGRSVSGPVMR